MEKLSEVYKKKGEDVSEEGGMGTGITGTGDVADGVLGDGDNRVPKKVGKKPAKRTTIDDEDEE